MSHSRCATATTSRATSPTALTSIAADDQVGYVEAVESVVDSFEVRDAISRGRPVADTALVLDRSRAVAVSTQPLPASTTLPAPSSRSRPASIAGWKAIVIVWSGCVVVLELVDPLDQLVEQASQRLDLELRVHLGASELAVRGVQVEATLQLAQLCRLQLARETGRAYLRPDLQVLRDRPVRLLASARSRPARSALRGGACARGSAGGPDRPTAAGQARGSSAARSLSPSTCSTFRRSGWPSAFSCSGRSISRTSCGS